MSNSYQTQVTLSINGKYLVPLMKREVLDLVPTPTAPAAWVSPMGWHVLLTGRPTQSKILLTRTMFKYPTPKETGK